MPKQKSATKEKEKLKSEARKISVKEGCAYSVSDGFGLRFITPFALAIGASNAQIGFLTSIPSLLGSLSQLFTEKIMEKYSRKTILLWGITLQAICWLLMISVGIFFFVWSDKAAPYVLIIVYTLLAVFGAIIVPAWNSWMRDIVNAKNLGEYFGFRSRITGTTVLISMLFAGFLLDYFKETKLFTGFIILFGIACLARTISGLIMLKQYEPKFRPTPKVYFSFWQFLKHIPYGNFGKFTLYISAISLTASIAAPFFAVFVLKDLGFSYVVWTILIVTNILATILFLPFWGKVADKFGNLQVVKTTTAIIPFVPLLWILSIFINGYYWVVGYLILLELLAGFVWAGFGLASINFIYNATSREKMALCVSYFNVLNGIGIFIGATLGGFLASIPYFFGLSAIILVFLVSGILRLVVHYAFRNKVFETREDVKKLDLKRIEASLIHLTPKKFLTCLNLDIHHKIR